MKSRVIINPLSIDLIALFDGGCELCFSVPKQVMMNYVEEKKLVQMERVRLLYDEETGNDCLDEDAIERNNQKLESFVEKELTEKILMKFLKQLLC